MSVEERSLVDLIGDVYDCVLHPAHWQSLIKRLCQKLRLMQGVLGLYEPQSAKPLLRIQHGMPQAWYDRMTEFGIEMANFWGGPERVAQFPIGEVVIHSIANPDYDFASNRFARDWVRPQGIRDFAAMSVARNTDGLGTLVFTSDRLLEPGDDREMDLLRQLSPHIRRAIAISDILDFKTFDDDSNIRRIVDALPSGILLISSAGRLVYANAAADRSLRANDAIRIVDGHLTMRDPDLAAALAAAVATSSADCNLSERGSGIPARGSDGSRAMLYVLPLEYGALRHRMVTTAATAVFIATEGAQTYLPSNGLRVLYDLTPAEIRVCELLLAGLAPGEISEHVGVALSTIRTHLLRIFEKTGTNRQADVIRKISPLMFPSPFPAAPY